MVVTYTIILRATNTYHCKGRKLQAALAITKTDRQTNLQRAGSAANAAAERSLLDAATKAQLPVVLAPGLLAGRMWQDPIPLHGRWVYH
jgi:hypothetical protein